MRPKCYPSRLTVVKLVELFFKDYGNRLAPLLLDFTLKMPSNGLILKAHTYLIIGWILGLNFANAQTNPAPVNQIAPTDNRVILTPASPHSPQIHGPKIFGVRPGSPFLYSIPATGDRPMHFSADGLPGGLHLDESTGRISGTLTSKGTFSVTLHARNSLGDSTRPFKIIAGDEIALTPPMGWNSWNCWHSGISQAKVLQSAHGLVNSGLAQHGWIYVNIDDAWQGVRGGELNAIQPNPKTFPDFPAMAREIHDMGLKLGIYSTPWVTSYAGHVGGSSENAEGTWDHATMTKGPKNKKILPFAIGSHHFFLNDAKQWAAWGVDYLKFDWAPIEPPETEEMENAIRASGRDIVFSLSNNATNSLFSVIPEVSKIGNSWRLGNDISDNWNSVVGNGFHHDQWAPYSHPGHWNDPDMFEVGTNGGGTPKRLTAEEQYSHVSLWCLLSAPLLLGCDLDHLDDFTRGLLTNDEVIDLDQDELGRQATCVAKEGDCEVYAKPLADGSWAAGLFNLGKKETPVTVKWSDLGLSGQQMVRDLWRQKDVGLLADQFSAPVPSHGVVLIRIIPSN